MRRITTLTILAAAGLAALPPAMHIASASAATADDPAIRGAKASTLRALSTRVTLDVRDQPVSDIFDFIGRVTGAELEPIYLDDDSFDGINPETTITIRANNMPALSLLERVLARVEQAERPASSYTWQFTDTGSIEFGPKSILNRHQHIELYDISDLMFIVPRFDQAPEFDLSSALQSSQGGGGSSPFQGSQQQIDDTPADERISALVNLIETTVEPDQWVGAGGDGASISFFGNSLVVTAPDYVHRQINGYDFWPSRLQQLRRVDGRWEVRIRPETQPRRRAP
ncbi:MAG: hypothetical protein LAT64_00910 [Phycisphaerales bacterium]|nr:hypothetical protein [Planctomycetota bacterium]MCH8507322.1 hypothetical protein [Phycisphaerales bacterium]